VQIGSDRGIVPSPGGNSTQLDAKECDVYRKCYKGSRNGVTDRYNAWGLLTRRMCGREQVTGMHDVLIAGGLEGDGNSRKTRKQGNERLGGSRCIG
jgi:hypothetical protein